MSTFETKICLVKKHLEEGKKITSWQAIQLYQATRLSAIIFVLKNKYGMNIATNMIHNPINGTRYAEYELLKQDK